MTSLMYKDSIREFTVRCTGVTAKHIPAVINNAFYSYILL